MKGVYTQLGTLSVWTVGLGSNHEFSISSCDDLSLEFLQLLQDEAL